MNGDVIAAECDRGRAFQPLGDAIQHRQATRPRILNEFPGRLGTESVNGVGAAIFEAEIGLIGTGSSSENIHPGSMSVDADTIIVSLKLNEGEIEPVKAVVIKAVITVGEDEINARYL